MKIEIPSKSLQHMDLAKPKEDAEKLKICNNPKQPAITKETQVSKKLVKYILKKYNIY